MKRGNSGVSSLDGVSSLHHWKRLRTATALKRSRAACFETLESSNTHHQPTNRKQRALIHVLRPPGAPPIPPLYQTPHLNPNPGLALQILNRTPIPAERLIDRLRSAGGGPFEGAHAQGSSAYGDEGPRRAGPGMERWPIVVFLLSAVTCLTTSGKRPSCAVYVSSTLGARPLTLAIFPPSLLPSPLSCSLPPSLPPVLPPPPPPSLPPDADASCDHDCDSVVPPIQLPLDHCQQPGEPSPQPSALNPQP
jgi:hypothetical protein